MEAAVTVSRVGLPKDVLVSVSVSMILVALIESG